MFFLLSCILVCDYINLYQASLLWHAVSADFSPITMSMIKVSPRPLICATQGLKVHWQNYLLSMDFPLPVLKPLAIR